MGKIYDFICRVLNKHKINRVLSRNKISLFAQIDSQTRIARNVAMERFVKIINCDIDEYSYIGKGSDIINCSIGKFCSISRDVKINLGNHPTKLLSTSPVFYSKKNILKVYFGDRNICYDEFKTVIIGNDVWIGTNVIILGGITIGDGAIIGAGAIVTKEVPPYAIVAGSPAKVIKYRFNENTIKILVKMKWWKWDIEKIKESANIFNDINLFN